MTFVPPSPAASIATPGQPIPLVRHLGRPVLLGAAALGLACGGWLAGSAIGTGQPDAARVGARLDQVEGRIQSLELETVHDGGTERFRAARAMILDLGKEIDTLRTEAATRQARLESRIDRLEKQISADTPTASIAARSGIDPTVALIPAPAPALSADISSPERESLVAAATTEPARTSADYRVTEIYRGQAIVEGHAGIWRVAVGDTLPGLGRVEAIEPRGKGWAVVTAAGTVTSRND